MTVFWVYHKHWRQLHDFVAIAGQEEVGSEAFVYIPEAYRQQMIQQQLYNQQQQVLAQQQHHLQQQQQQQPQVREMYVARRPDGQVQAFLPPTANPNQPPMVRKPVLYRNPATGQGQSTRKQGQRSRSLALSRSQL